MRWQILEQRDRLWWKHPPTNPEDVQLELNPFDIDAKWPFTRDAVERQIRAVGQVEAEPGMPGQGRLAIRTQLECELGRTERQIPRQNQAQARASDDVPIPIASKMKSRRTGAFVFV